MRLCRHHAQIKIALTGVQKIGDAYRMSKL
jgi:hypothetical protein